MSASIGGGRARLDHSDAVRACVALGQAHVRAEMTNELEGILDTVSDEPWFPLLNHGPDGGVVLDLRRTSQEVRDYYAARGTTYDIVASQYLHAISTDWFYFRESVATLRHVGEVDGVAPSGEEFQVNSAVLFPAARDGIAGEIVWTRYPFGSVLEGTAAPPAPPDGPAHLPLRQLRNARVHDDYVTAWRNGDPDAARPCLADDAQWLGRRWSADGRSEHRIHRGRAAVLDGIRHDHDVAPVQTVEVFNRIVADWYVLAEYRVVVDATEGPVERQVVALYPVDADGRLRAEMSEQRDVAVPRDEPPSTG